MSTVNGVASVGNVAALQLPARPSEGSNNSPPASPPPPVSDSYTPGQEGVIGSGGLGRISAAQEYQKIAKLGTGNNAGAQEQGVSAVQQQEGANAINTPAPQNQAMEAVKKANSPNQVQQDINNLMAKPDAAIMSTISMYA